MNLLRSQVVPVFPLPGVVLFPRVVLPLHIFEPRYRAMLDEVLDGAGLIAMAFASPQGEPDDEGSWSISNVVGLGEVVTYQKNEDGTSNVVLVGSQRARVEEWIEGKPFRTARISPLKDVRPRSHVARDRLKADLSAWIEAILRQRAPEEEAENLLRIFRRDTDVGFLADFLAYQFLKEGEEKQRVFEELDVEKRVQSVRALLEARGLI